jgi:phosphatidylglycerol lysyltransferase
VLSSHFATDRDRVLALLKRHGYNATSFQTLGSEFRYGFDGDDACVAYVDTGRAWVVAGAPIASAERMASVAHAFAEQARTAGRRIVFFGTESRFTDAVASTSLLIGEQPVWDPAGWGEILRSSRSLREQLRRARAKGVTVRLVDSAELAQAAPLRCAVDGLIARWLGSRSMAPMGFLVHLEPCSFLGERRCFVAEVGGAVVGFLVVVPVFERRGWFFENVLRDPSAPNGTTELLVDAAMRMATDEDSRYVTLGLVPLAGGVTRGLRVARRWGAGLYDFGGLHAFKAKLRPHHWEPLYLSYPSHQSGLVAIADTLAAFARGGLLRFGLATLLRGPAIVFELLGYLLVPWTVLLALAPTAGWFPAPWVKWAWVLFDVCILTSLLGLKLYPKRAAQQRRRSRILAGLLAALVTADALVTTLEASWFNLPRASSVGEVALVLVAIAAPTFAAILLWSAWRHFHAPPRELAT